MRKTAVRAGGPVVVAMLVAFMGCSGEPPRTAGPSPSEIKGAAATPSPGEVLSAVDGLQDRLPAQLQNVPDLVMTLKDLQVKDGAIVRNSIDSNAPTTRTGNGQVDPMLAAQTNQTQLLRLANIGADIWYRLRLASAQFRVIAEDANPVAEVWTADELVLPPGKRYDVLVRWPTPGTYALETLPYNTGPDGDNYPQRRLATFQTPR